MSLYYPPPQPVQPSYKVVQEGAAVPDAVPSDARRRATHAHIALAWYDLIASIQAPPRLVQPYSIPGAITPSPAGSLSGTLGPIVHLTSWPAPAGCVAGTAGPLVLILRGPIAQPQLGWEPVWLLTLNVPGAVSLSPDTPPPAPTDVDVGV